MKNKLFIIFFIFFFNSILLKAHGVESFNFDITEIQILEGKCDNIERLVDEHC